MDLRPYQSEAVAAIESHWGQGNRHTLLVLPTGTGKTVVFASLAEKRVRLRERGLILAHRGELLEQAQEKIKLVTGLNTALEKAESSAVSSWYPITVGSVQSLAQEKRLAEYPADRFDYIVVDEAHHVLSDQYQKVLSHFPDAKVLGVTATPDRGDRKSLASFFQSIAYEYTLPQAIKDGYLCKLSAQMIPLKLDLSGVTVQNGDFAAGALGSALEPYLEQIADEMAHYCLNRKTVVFLPLISTSRRFKQLLSLRGFRAAEVNGNSEDRAQVLADFAGGKYNVLCNSMLLTEGWDCPSVDCVVVLRPTKVRALYCQMIGRGTRPAPGKENLLILDFLWMSERHPLCRPASLLAPDEPTRHAMEKIIGSGEETDLEAAMDQAESDAAVEREAALAEELKKMRNRRRQLVDPLQYASSIRDFALLESDGFEADMQKITQKQRDFLEQHGIFPDNLHYSGEAEKIIGALRRRADMGLATPKQIRVLERNGFTGVGTWSFQKANRLIALLSKNNWRLPANFDRKAYSAK